jgi:hypothetical protein
LSTALSGFACHLRFDSDARRFKLICCFHCFEPSRLAVTSNVRRTLLCATQCAAQTLLCGAQFKHMLKSIPATDKVQKLLSSEKN